MSLYSERSRIKLKNEITKEVTHLFEKCLDFVEVTLPDKQVYKLVRSKVLRSGNNAIREISKNIDENYTISFSPETGLNEDIIEFKKNV